MATADVQLPVRLMAGGGPSTPDARVLSALSSPLIGQFDPDFTSLMDEVMQLARATFLTSNRRCFAVSALASGGLEAVLNSVVEQDDRVAIDGSPGFVRAVADSARRCGVRLASVDDDSEPPELLIVPFVDGWTGERRPIADIAAVCRARGTLLVVDATVGLAAAELHVDDWGVDICLAGVDHAIGAPSGLTLVTYTEAVEARMAQRATPPRTSYLDLVQLQAYWSAERLNHHTAPTSLVYGVREALRLVQVEGLVRRWERHELVARQLRRGLENDLHLDVHGDPPLSIVRLPSECDEAAADTRLREEFGVHVSHVGPHTWRVGLLGADARPDAAEHVLTALAKVLHLA